MNKKESNPKDSIGVKKVPMHYVSCRVLMEMGLGMLDGGCKYGAHNYREAGVKASVYYDAAMRHLMSWWEGEDDDPDTGLSHITKVLTCLATFRDAMIAENWEDDRPIRIKGGAGVTEYNEQAANIIDKYPDPVLPYTEKAKKEVRGDNK